MAGQLDVPTGTYTAVAVYGLYACAIADDGSIACWGNVVGTPPDTSTGTYSSLAAHDLHTCAIHTDGTITCWPRLPDGVEWATSTN